MAGANFQAILNTRADTVEAPKQLPPGKYQAQVKSFDTGESTKTKSPYVEVKFLVESAIDILSEYQELADKGFAKGPVEMRSSYYLTDKAMYRLVDFLEKDLGIPRGGKTLAQMLEQCIGQQCGVVLDTGTTKDGKEFIEIKRTMAL